MRKFSNFWGESAAYVLSLAHRQSPWVRGAVLAALVGVWLYAGLTAWGDLGLSEALYRTLGALQPNEQLYQPGNVLIEVVRSGGLVIPLVAAAYFYSGFIGRSIAKGLFVAAARHVVVAGSTRDALLLTEDSRRAGDSVVLISRDIAEDTGDLLRRKGVFVIEGDPLSADNLRAARATHAAHVVALTDNDADNFEIEATMRRLMGNARRKPPIGLHISVRSPLLMREARAMHTSRAMQALYARRGAAPAAAETWPFSVHELAARILFQREAVTLLNLAKQRGQDRVHIVCFGLGDVAEALVVCILKTLWSIEFEAPRITVLTRTPEDDRARFQVKYAGAFAYPDVWAADVEFLYFDWEAQAIEPGILEDIEERRGPVTAAVVSTGASADNIQVSMALQRTCNHGNRWPIPIFMHEPRQTEFSRQYARGDETAELDAYVQAFGADQQTLTRGQILLGVADQGAAIAHNHYVRGRAEQGVSERELKALSRDWGQVLETYRSANRASADSAIVKVWDCGWVAAERGAKGAAPAIPDDRLTLLAKREHERWIAERLMSGWKPARGEDRRSNTLWTHDKLVPWDQLAETDQHNDIVQVRAGIDIARVMHPHGFVRRMY